MRVGPTIVFLVATASWGGAALAAEMPGEIRGQVRVTRAGQPVADAGGVLVYLTGFTEPPPPETPQMRQHGRQFEPALLAIVAGQTVAFPNGDPFFHNVFSVSPARRFDLGQFKNGEAKEKVFPSPGVVEVYCNIHPEMAATILILPNRRFVTTAPDGSFRLDDVPPGSWSLFAYHRLAPRPTRLEVSVEPGQTTRGVVVDVDERGVAAPHANKYGERYGSP